MNKLKTLDDFMQEIIEERYLSNLKRILEVNSKETIISFIKEASQRYSKYIAIEFQKWGLTSDYEFHDNTDKGDVYASATSDELLTIDQLFDQFIKERS